MTVQTKTGAAAIRDIFAEARRAHEELRGRDTADADPHAERAGVKPGKWDGAPYAKMPPQCPVQVLGKDAIGRMWCRNATGDVVCVEKWDAPTVSHLFAPTLNYAFWAWPAWGPVKDVDADTGKVTEELRIKRIEVNRLFACLYNEAARRPEIFDPDTQLRGRGGWADTNGEFIWHSGKHLWRSDKGRLQHAPPGEYDGHLYTRQALTIEPWDGPVSKEETPARRVLDYLKSWNWERQYLDPLLVLGWIVTALMGGALRHRPIIFTTGGFGVGKSTLHELVGHVLERFVVRSANTTAAGVYQKLRFDAIPLLIDELESKPGSDRATAVIELARIAYSGDELNRGSQDHRAMSFSLRSSFMFSAINMPPMMASDRSRMAVLNLARLDLADGAKRLMLMHNASDGRMILRQVMDGWREFCDKLMPYWWRLLQNKGFDGRAIDTYGTLLAAAELVVGHEAIEACGLPITDEARLAEIITAATEDERRQRLDTWHKCLIHLLQSPIQAWRDGKRPTVGGVMQDLADNRLLADEARDRLQLIGLTARGADAKGGPYLCVPPDGPALVDLFAKTEFQQGVWHHSLKQAPKDIVLRGAAAAPARINGTVLRCNVIDMTAFNRHAEKVI